MCVFCWRLRLDFLNRDATLSEPQWIQKVPKITPWVPVLAHTVNGSNSSPATQALPFHSGRCRQLGTRWTTCLGGGGVPVAMATRTQTQG